MTDKEDFFDFIYCGGDYGGNRKFYKTDLTAEEVYNWFQSKQQEKIERVRKLPSIYIESHPSGIKDGQFLSISDVLKIMEEK